MYWLDSSNVDSRRNYGRCSAAINCCVDYTTGKLRSLTGFAAFTSICHLSRFGLSVCYCISSACHEKCNRWDFFGDSWPAWVIPILHSNFLLQTLVCLLSRVRARRELVAGLDCTQIDHVRYQSINQSVGQGRRLQEVHGGVLTFENIRRDHFVLKLLLLSLLIPNITYKLFRSGYFYLRKFIWTIKQMKQQIWWDFLYIMYIALYYSLFSSYVMYFSFFFLFWFLLFDVLCVRVDDK